MSATRRYRSDDRDLEGHDLDLVVHPPDGNGDWYVSVLPHGHKIGPTVRVTTSGTPAGHHGVCGAVARLYRAMGGEEEPTLPSEDMWPTGQDWPTLESMSAELAAVREELARRREQDARVGATADLLAKIDAFRAQHKAATGQDFTQEEAVRVLLLVGLDAKLKDRRCPKCGGPFPEGKRVDAKWCSDDCRASASATTRYHRGKPEKSGVVG